MLRASQKGLTSAFKTSNRSDIISGLYWAGGSVNPGPGVPMTLMSGQIAANCVIEDFGVVSKSKPALVMA